MNNIRNFSIIAHIDHGKTTLTDQLLKKTGTVTSSIFHERILDSNPIEQERGITIKLAPVRMLYQLKTTNYQLNLIDTPGHVDFSYEVSRSLSACEGAVLVVDAVKGIQAQTIANYDKAREHNLVVIPVVNKIDLENAEPDRVAQDLQESFGFREEDILFASAKTGRGVDDVLQAVVNRIPAPRSPERSRMGEVGQTQTPLRALIFNSMYHPHKGVIAFVKVVEGKINQDNRKNLFLYQTKRAIEALELGFFSPDMKETEFMQGGEVGYVATGLKDIREVQVGDTITEKGADITPIPGYRKPQPMVYMDMYPAEADDYQLVAKGLEKLALNDAALTYRPIASQALGNGFRVGYLGILHAEIVSERLVREFEATVINTSPSVPYKVHTTAGAVNEIASPADFPDPEKRERVEEPMVNITLYTPENFLGNIMDLCESKRATFQDMQYVRDKVRLTYHMPLSELITNFYDRLKSASSGYASVSYEHAGYEEIKAVKVDILLNKEPAEALAFVAPAGLAEGRARALVTKLASVIPRQQFEVPIQAAIGGKIIARETIKAFRKDVTAKLYGGDRTRRMKLLEKQKKGKKRMKRLGSVEVPQEAFTEVLKI